MPICTICGEKVEIVAKCKKCGDNFCVNCGSTDNKICLFCAEDDNEDDNKGWDD